MDTKINIAVVDDEIEIFDIFKMRFHKEIKNNYYLFHFFENGKLCYDFLNKSDDDVDIIIILSDIKMPVMDGFSLLDLVKKKYPHIAVYLISAFATDDYVNTAKEKGAKELLAKPVDFDLVKEKIEECYEDYLKNIKQSC